MQYNIILAKGKINEVSLPVTQVDVIISEWIVRSLKLLTT